MATPLLLTDFKTRIISLYEAGERAKKTVKRIDQLLDELVDTLGEDALTTDLTTEGVARWMARYKEGRALDTRIGYLGYLRAAVSWAVEEGWLDRPPSWRRLRPRRHRKPPGPHHSLSEVRTLLAHFRREAIRGDWKDWRDYALLATALYIGARRSELLFLRLKDVDLKRGIIEIVPLSQRGLKTELATRLAPIPPELGKILRPWLPMAAAKQRKPRWLIPNATGRNAWHAGSDGARPIDRLKAKALDCGVATRGWQMMRRTWATHAESRWELPSDIRVRLLGHASPLTSREFYSGDDPDNLRRLGRRISYCR
jgi:integrase